MSKVKKIFGVQAIAECPCDVCEHTQQCADKRLACKIFESWVNGGLIQEGERNPTRRLYQRVYFGAMESTWEEPRQFIVRNDLEGAA